MRITLVRIALGVLGGLVFLVSPRAMAARTMQNPASGAAVIPSASLGATIKGTVRNSVTNQPVTGVKVIVNISSDRRDAVSDSSGAYSLSDMPPGRHTVSVTKYPDYEPGSRSVTASAGQASKTIDFALVPTGVLAGRVLEEDRSPVPGVRVQAFEKSYTNGVLRYQPTQSSVTNDLGEYRLAGIRHGREYVVVAGVKSPIAFSTAPPKSDAPRPEAVTTYFPNAPNFAGAVALVLQPGEKREGLDIRLARRRAFCMQAKVDAAGENQYLRVNETVGTRETFLAYGRVERSGVFYACGLPAGEYRLMSTANLGTEEFIGKPAERGLFGSTPFTIVDRDVTNLSVTLAPLVPIAGRLVWQDDPPKDVVKVEPIIALEPRGREQWAGEVLFTRAVLPGPFSFRGLIPDEYQVRIAALPPGLYVKSITYGPHDLARERLSGIDGVTEMRIVIGWDGGVIRASVVTKDGEPIPDAWVTALLKDSGPEDAAGFGRQCRTDDSGICEVTAAPGEYYMVATSGNPQADPNVKSAILGARFKAAETAVGPRGTAGVSLRLLNVE